MRRGAVLSVGWTAVATACAVWWGPALANAEVQDEARRLTDDARPLSVRAGRV